MWEMLIPLVAGGAAAAGAYAHNRERMDRWEEAARSCGLDVMERSSLWALRPRVRARSGAMELSIADSRENKRGIRVSLAFPGPPSFGGVRIRREPPFRLSKTREIEVGDDAFDVTFSVEGPVRLVRVLLDAETRRLLVKIDKECKVEIVDGEIRAETVDVDVPHVVSLLVKLGQRLAVSVDVVERLAENARRDPRAGVRLQNLLLLAREFRGEPKTLAALREACEETSPQVRLRAARELGDEGRDVLLALAESKVDDDTSAQAIAWLGSKLPCERARVILDYALRRRLVRTARAAVERLGGSQAAADVDLLTKVLGREAGELAAAAALALGESGIAAAEPALIQALARDDPEVRVAAATALGPVGSVAAVLPLKEAAEGSLLDRDLRRAARQAIAEIQSRLEGASPGQLSLALADAGQLSLAGTEAGQLSLARAEGGQVSLASDSAERPSPPPAEPE